MTRGPEHREQTVVKTNDIEALHSDRDAMKKEKTFTLLLLLLLLLLFVSFVESEIPSTLLLLKLLVPRSFIQR